MEKMEYGLTFPQKNIWLVENYNKGTALNVIAGSVKINRGFDEEKCEIAINKVIEENVAMRTRIKEEKGKVMQYFAPYSYEKIEVVDLSSLSKKEILEYIDGLTFQSFFAKDKKLYNFKILRTGKNSGYIFMCIHHIISDAWSCSKIVKSLTETLETIGTRSENSEEKIVPEYTEYIEKEEEYKNSDKYVKDEEFWNEYLKGFSEVVSFKDKKKTSSLKANRYSVKLDKDLNDRITNYCKENKISPYALFLTAISTYIYRVKDKNDFVLGTPVLNRANFKEKQMLGMFVSTLPLRVKVEENIKFLDLAKEISKNNFSMFRHQKYPYSKMLEFVHKNSDIKNNLYNIAVSFQNAKTDIMDNDKYETNWTFSKALDDEMQIHISDIDDTGIYSINYDYKEELFGKIEVEYIHLRLMSIIENAIKDVDVDVENIEIMPESEKNKILYEFNNTKKEYTEYDNVIQIFNEQVIKNPEKIAFVFQKNEFSYRYLDEKSDKVANILLTKYKIKPNTIVSLVLNRSIDMIVSILGILKAGACYLPIDPEFPKQRIEYIISNSKTDLIITNVYDEFKKEFDLKSGKILDYKELENTKIEENNLKNIIKNSDNLAYIIYTSGTTGNPKGTMISHKNLINFIEAYYDRENLKECNVAISLAKYSFDMFIIDTIIPLFKGIKVIFADENESVMPNSIIELISLYKVETLSITPSKLDMVLSFLKNKYEFLSSLKKVTMGGEVFNTKCYKILKNINENIEVYNAYGPTEITVASSVIQIKTVKEDISIGKPLNNVNILILDSKRRLLPYLCVGEQYILGNGVCKGYLNNTELTNQKFVSINNKRAYNSGDLVYLGVNNELYYVGRKDNQVKLNGLRIELEEIENRLKSIEYIRNCIVLVDKINNREQIFAYLITNGKEKNETDIKQRLSENLPRYMIPNHYIFLDEFPINSSGKIDSYKLKELNKKVKESKVILAQNPLQKEISDIVNKNLKIDKLDINTSFFEYGMDSLDAIKISADISSKFNIEIYAKEIFENNTIATIEKELKKHSKKETAINYQNLSDSKIYPLTAIQKGLFSIYSQDPDRITYNTPFEIKFSKNIDKLKLITSIEKAIQNHEVFGYRVFFDKDGEVYQKYDKIKSPIISKVEKVKINTYRRKKRNFVKPFDLLKDRLFRINLYETEENVYALFDFSHIIFDGASIYIFIEDIINLYNDGTTKEEKISFGQLCKKNSISKSIDKYNKAKEFFLNEFDGELPVNNFIYDKPRPNEKTFRGDTLKFNLGSRYYDKLKEICKEKNLTINSLLLAAFNILLSKYMYSEDIIIGIATSGRMDKSELNTIGMFIKTLPFRTRVKYDETILSFTNDVQEKLMNTLENSIYSYDDLLKELNILKDVSRNPLFDIMFVYQNGGKDLLEIGKEKAEISSIKTHTSKFDITCEVMPNIETNSLNINLEYSTDIFNEKTIKALGKHYINTIKYFVENINGSLSDIEIVDKVEKKVIIDKFNDNKTDYPRNKTVHELFEEQVKKHPNKKAVILEGKYLTYKELNERANILANFLIDKDVKKGDIVALLLDKSIEYIVGALASLKCGAAYVAITNDLPEERAKYMITNSNAKVILTSKEFFRNIVNLPTYYIDSQDIFSDSIYSKKNLEIKCNATDLLHVIYTSGSTGIPKGNMIKHRGMVRLLLNTNYVDFESNDIMLTSSSLTFDTSGFEVWGAMLYGMTLHLMKKENILNLEYYGQYLKDNKITATFIPTPIFHQMVENNYKMFKDIKYIYVGGDVLLPKYTNIMFEKLPNVKVYNAYGPAEITVICCAQLIDKIYTSDIPLGKVVSNNNVYILDKCQNICPIGCPGELYVSGDGLGYGYINRDDLTKEKFIKVKNIDETVYKSGDLTLWNEYGEVRYVSRIDSQLKIRGQRVEILEIQNRMLMLKEIKEVALKVVTNSNNVQYLIAYYTVNEDININKIKKYLSVYLPVYMIPYRFIKIDEMPLNQNGKIDKNKLPEVSLVEDVTITVPQNQIQENILNVFKKVLNNNKIGMESDFFENGGDSLLVVKLISELNIIGVNITYANAFAYKTPLAIYRFLYEKDEKESISAGIEYINYKEINKLLLNNKLKEDTIITARKKVGNVLITGVTGFLGIHVLKELVDDGVEKIFCLVRKKNNLDVVERTKKQLEFFFDGEILEKIKSRIIVVEGDITNSHIFVRDEDYENVVDNIDVVINCAASVKHYGKFEKFYDINVKGTQNIIRFCVKNNKELVHISTLSVSGNIIEGGQIIQKNLDDLVAYDETKLYVGQNLDNVYAYTKFLAEKYVLESIVNEKLKAKIIRMGNLTGRYLDGRFQPNVKENAFANRIKTIVDLKIMPENMMRLYLEMTPIDYAAKAVVDLTKLKGKYNVFHVFNDKHAMMPFVVDAFRDVGIELKLLSEDETKKLISEYLKDKEKFKEIDGIIADINEDGMIEYNENIKIKSDFTKKILKKFKFEWPVVTKEYFIKYLEYLKSIGFLKY